MRSLLVMGIPHQHAPEVPTLKITEEQHPEPPESRTDVRAAHSVGWLVSLL